MTGARITGNIMVNRKLVLRSFISWGIRLPACDAEACCEMVIYGRFSLFLVLLYARWKNKLYQSERMVDRLRAGLIWQCAGHVDIIVFRDVTSFSLVEVHRCSGIITSLSVTQQPNSGLGRFIVEVSISHTIRHTRIPRRNPLKEWLPRRRSRYVHNTQQTQETNILSLTGVQTRDRKPAP